MPSHSFLNIKSREHGKPTSFYESLLQVNSIKYCKVINLEHPTKDEEVFITKKRDWFSQQRKHINTGIEHSDIYNGGEIGMLTCSTVVSNVDNSLLAVKGCIFRTYSESDLNQLQALNDAVNEKKEIPEIDPDTILATFPFE